MSSINNKTTDKNSEEIELIKLLGEFIDHRRIIISITAFFVLLAVLYTLFSTPVYQADAMVQIQQKQGNAILSNITQMLPDSQPLSAPEITLLQSRMILGKTVDDLNLQANVTEDHFPIFGRGWARIMGKVPGEIVLSQFFLPANISKENNEELTLTVIDSNNFKISGETINFEGRVGELFDKDGILLKIDKIKAKEGTTFTINYLTKLQAISLLQKRFTASDASKDSGMLQLTYQDTNASLAQKILQSISDNYLAQNVALQAAQDEKSLDFLNNQLPKVRNDLDSAEDLLNNYRQKKDSVDLTMEAKSVLDQIVNVDNQLNELTFKEAEISQLFTKEHPTYKALMEKRKTLQDEKAKLNQRVSLMPETQQEVLRLSRDVDSGKAVYMQLLTKQQELSIAKSSVIGNVRIVDSAITQPKPVKPNAILVIFIGIVVGLIISSGLVLLRIFIRKGVESPEQLEELGINVYASVPISESLVKKNSRNKNNISYDSGPLAIENPADLAIEAIRGLRTSLHFAMMEAKNKVLMISGATPSAGKTFISTNLSVIIATTGKKVLLIDADMRKGYVHKLFSVENDNGLSNYLSGKSLLTEVVKKTKYEGIDFIPRGMVPPNPAELLMHSRFEQLISWADSNYDIVVIDTPPVLAVTDPVIIGRYAGTVLLVARFEENTIKEIEVSVRRFEQNGIDIKGCILNGLVKKASSYYGYGYNHYGYEYKDKK
ncbi:polysaccharide biosynthesis tyrosine autokinase [Raoultella terrigena]|uniref:polysaccharide biosynthesis tyrosine autokinase n=1 Tax=Raoultella terrigena TaxID=577 RepID=UPI000F4CD145|nr:polysaccharide biosynthesis tyrosine autokinase [Raoultella terrigena]ROR98355.1 tyrosine-protein kinase Etk/Wzc [Raoultella terrigena]